MRIGYACLTVGVPNTDLKSCMMKNASIERLEELITYNSNSLERIIEYNIRNNIKLFRISSDLIPFGSSPVNNLPWWEIFIHQFERIGNKIKENGMRVSMHPGQYTVLNSPDKDVVKRAIEDLNYHARVLDCLRVGEDNKIILHIGGIYKDKSSAVKRFVNNFQYLEEAVKRRLVIENDDKSYNIKDVLEIGIKLNIPVVFDNLHNAVNACGSQSEFYWIEECIKTWGKEDGLPKIHYSQQNPDKKSGSHSSTIRAKEFMQFYENIPSENLDIMLEVKDKNLSAVKCINCISEVNKIQSLEAEWSRYKYTVLEHSLEIYLKIRSLMEDKKTYPVVSFYSLIEEAMCNEITIGNFYNAAEHVWGYFKNTATEREKINFIKGLDQYRQGEISAAAIKKNLLRMAVKYRQQYLINSYYFIL